MIDFTKPVRTLRGDSVRILCTDRKSHGLYPVLALIGPEEDAVSYTAEGRVSHQGKPPFVAHPRDLENIPEQRVRFVNVYSDGFVGSGYESFSLAFAQRQAVAGYNAAVTCTTYQVVTEGTKIISYTDVE